MWNYVLKVLITGWLLMGTVKPSKLKFSKYPSSKQYWWFKKLFVRSNPQEKLSLSLIQGTTKLNIQMGKTLKSFLCYIHAWIGQFKLCKKRNWYPFTESFEKSLMSQTNHDYYLRHHLNDSSHSQLKVFQICMDYFLEH